MNVHHLALPYEFTKRRFPELSDSRKPPEAIDVRYEVASAEVEMFGQRAVLTIGFFENELVSFTYQLNTRALNLEQSREIAARIQGVYTSRFGDQ